MKTQLFVIVIIVMLISSGFTSAQSMKEPNKKSMKKSQKSMQKSMQKSGEKVDINFATLEELQMLPGIDAETAQAIIDGRPYANRKELRELLETRNIKKNTFAKLQRFIFVRRLTINLATLEELEALPGFEPEIAQAIFDGKPYNTDEDLLNVEGIDQDKLESFYDFIQIKININAALLDELISLPGIDPTIARAIVEGGDSYETVDELLQIKGIDEEKLATLRDFIETTPAERGSGERGRRIPGGGR